MKLKLSFLTLGLVVGLTGLFTACAVESVLPPIPTDIPIPTVTLTPSPPAVEQPGSMSATLTLTPTGVNPVRSGTALPPAGEPITIDNAGRLSPLAWQGRGIPARMALSNDGHLLAVSTTRGVFIYDPATLTELERIDTPLPQLALAFSPIGDRVASAGLDGVISLWQVQDGRLLRQFKSGVFSNTTAMVFSPDGSRLLSTDTDRVTHIWQVADGKEQDPILDNARIIRLLAFSSDSAHLLSWAPVEPVKVWNLDTHQKEREISVSADELGKNAINGVFSADGAVFAANSGLRVRVYSTRTGYTQQLIRLDVAAQYLLLSGDGRQLAVVGQKQLSLYQVGSKDDPLVLPLPADFPASGGSCFAPDASSLLLMGPGLATWKLEADSQPVASRVDFTPDYVLSSVFLESTPLSLHLGLDGTFQIRDRAGLLQKNVRLDEPGLNAAAISPDGSSLVTSSKQRGVALWSAEGKWTSSLSTLVANNLAFSGTGLVAAAMPNGWVNVWQAGTGAVKLDVKMGNPPQQVLISPDGKTMAARTREEVFWWDISGGSARQLGRFSASGMALSGDGRYLAVSRSSMGGQSISLYRPDSTVPLNVIDAGGNWMVFSPDSSLLAVAGDPLQIWRVSDATRLQQLSTAGLLGQPYFIDQGRHLALVGWDGSLRLWGLP